MIVIYNHGKGPRDDVTVTSSIVYSGGGCRFDLIQQLAFTMRKHHGNKKFMSLLACFIHILHHHNTNDGGAAQCGVCGAAAGSIYPSLLNGYRGILPFIAQLKW